MTIASEIDRINTAKSNIKQAIIDKGVDVPDTDKIDTYADCISEIKAGGGGYYLDYLVIGGGGGGGSSPCSFGGGGGGAGGVKEGTKTAFIEEAINVCVGAGGHGDCNYYKNGYPTEAGCGSAFGNIYAGGGGPGFGMYITPGPGASSGGGFAGESSNCYYAAPTTGLGRGNPGGFIKGSCGGAGGGGAGGMGGVPYYGMNCVCYCCGNFIGYGGFGISSCITGKEECFAGGGGARGMEGKSGGGQGKCGGSFALGCNATTCGSGGGAGVAYVNSGYYCYKSGGDGAGGIVVVRYPKDGSYGITNAIGGCKYECGDYCIHCFTTDGYFIPNGEVSGKYISYVVVGGGGNNSSYAFGGGGAVCFGTTKLTDNSLTITVGGAGAASSLSDPGFSVTAPGGCNGVNCTGGKSGSGYKGYTSNSSSYMGTGGGACGEGTASGSFAGAYGSIYGFGGDGIFGFGIGGSRCYDGRKGASCNCCICTNYGTSGKQGVVDVCYPKDGSYGFTSATGGNCCYECGDMCVHRFTSSGTFTVTS